MKLIIGLGNPDAKYDLTRHNIGHRVVDEVAKSNLPAKIYKTTVFMNVSGGEVGEKLRFHKLEPRDLLVIHDDLDLPFGEMRLQFGRSSAGHHGVDSIIAKLGTADFWRLRIGIGPRGEVPGDQFVLERFSSVEENKLPQVIKEAEERVQSWLKDQN